MKILHVNASDVGSTGKIIEDISREATKRGWTTIFLCARSYKGEVENIKRYIVSSRFAQAVYHRCHYLTGLKYGFEPFSTARALKIIKKEKPDVVHLHSVNCCTVNVYKILDFLKKNNIPTVITNHAEYFYTGSCSHSFDCLKWKTGCGKCPRLFYASDSKLFDRTHTAWVKMKKSFENFKNIEIVSVSPWVFERSKSSPIMDGLSQSIILNGVNTEVFKKVEANSLRDTLGVNKYTKIVLQVTASFSDVDKDSKGGYYLVELAKRMQDKNVLFVVVGNNNVKNKLPDNIKLVGPIYDQEKLNEYYNVADLTIVTSKRETFGMTVAESLCAGTAVVGFESGGSESIAIDEFCSFVPFGDVVKLQVCVVQKLERQKTEKIIYISKGLYSDKIMSKKYCDLYKKMI